MMFRRIHPSSNPRRIFLMWDFYTPKCFKDSPFHDNGLHIWDVKRARWKGLPSSGIEHNCLRLCYHTENIYSENPIQCFLHWLDYIENDLNWKSRYWAVLVFAHKLRRYSKIPLTDLETCFFDYHFWLMNLGERNSISPFLECNALGSSGSRVVSVLYIIFVHS